VIKPQALLLDFGGVIAEAPPQSDISDRLINAVHRVVQGAVDRGRIAAALTAASGTYAKWRDTQTTEIPHEHLWAGIVAPDWPETARQAVRREAGELSRIWAHRVGWQVRPGIPECLAAGLPVAVVSNTLSGAAHRDFLDQAGLSPLIAAQVYSDEIGLRKPDPGPAAEGAARLGVPVGRCWFVGDSMRRDIACARRAGTGAAILMRSRRTATESPPPGVTPDATIDDGYGLIALLSRLSSPAP